MSEATSVAPRAASNGVLTRGLQVLQGALVPVAAVVVALLIGAVVLVTLGANPFTAYLSLLEGAFGSVSGFTQTLVTATPLLLVGLGVTIAFRGGVINIGGEGQLIVGALASTQPLSISPCPVCCCSWRRSSPASSAARCGAPCRARSRPSSGSTRS